MIASGLGHMGWYGWAVGGLLAAKLLLSIRRKSSTPKGWAEPRNIKVAAVVTVYNETADALAHCLDSLGAQTRRLDHIHVTDDGSRVDYTQVRAWFLAKAKVAGITVTWVRTPNQGKRHALAEGFQAAPTADVYLCVDSDTVLAKDALALALRPFSKRNIHAVTGLVLARNRAVNILTRLIDMRYMNAFLGERVAYSRFGSVLCVCGSLALYRGWVVRKHLPDFLEQTFLGRPCTAGDDRRLTYYALLEGQAVIQPAAVAHTDVPEGLGHYARQQVRWTKSFIREGVLLFLTGRVGRVCWWLNLVELVTWVAFTGALVVAVAVATTHTYGPVLGVTYAGYVSAAAWVRSVHYLRSAGSVPLLDRWLTFAAAPLYALLNLVLLVPLRFYALATMRDVRWGTRAEVEVAYEVAA